MANKFIYELPQLFTISSTLKLAAYDTPTNTTYHFDLSLLGLGGNPADFLWNNTDSFDEGAIVTWSQGPGQPLQVWVSEIDGNVGNVPGPDSTFWSPGTSQRSGIVPWQAGVYLDDYPAVVYNNILYWLDLSVPRPYNSTNIVTEITAGDWIPLGGGGGSVSFGAPGDIPRVNATSDDFAYDTYPINWTGGVLNIGSFTDKAEAFIFNGSATSLFLVESGQNGVSGEYFNSLTINSDSSGATLFGSQGDQWQGSVHVDPNGPNIRLTSDKLSTSEISFLELYGDSMVLSTGFMSVLLETMAGFTWNDGAGQTGSVNFGAGGGFGAGETRASGSASFSATADAFSFSSADTAGNSSSMTAANNGDAEMTFFVDGSHMGKVLSSAVGEYFAWYLRDFGTSQDIGVYARKTGLELTALGLNVSIDALLKIKSYSGDAPVSGGVLYYGAGPTPTLAVSDGSNWYNVTTGLMI